MRRVVVGCATGMALLGIGGCSATVDRFSTRAQTYNDQADTIKEQQLLLNILRAAYREPMEFSDFTQVTGQSSLSGTLGFSLPISGFPTNDPRTYLTTPNATLSGTQSFTVANLDTQEFYEGLLSPIPMSTLDYYMEADYPKALVLTLFVDKIELMQMPDGKAAPPAFTITYQNSYRNGEYVPFRAMINTAILAGLDTETVRQTRPVGPPMTADELHEVKDMASLISQGVTLKTYKVPPPGEAPPGEPEDDAMRDPDLTPGQLAKLLPPGTTQYYRLVTNSSAPRFCFDPAGAAAIASDASAVKINAYLHSQYALLDGYDLIRLSIPSSSYCGHYDAPGSGGPSDEGGDDATTTPLEITIQPTHPIPGHLFSQAPEKFRVAITTRSVEQILYYLGEWTRSEIGLEGAAQAVPMISTDITVPGHLFATSPIAGTPAATTLGALNEPGDILFRIQPNDACKASLPSVHAGYFGHDYCMQIDPSAQDRSSQVMEIVAQLFALNNAAKNLPSPNVISVLSP